MWDTLNFMLNTLSHPALLTFVFGGLVGAWFYRWMLKRDPAKLELWAQELNKAAAVAKNKL